MRMEKVDEKVDPFFALAAEKRNHGSEFNLLFCWTKKAFFPTRISSPLATRVGSREGAWAIPFVGQSVSKVFRREKLETQVPCPCRAVSQLLVSKLWIPMGPHATPAKSESWAQVSQNTQKEPMRCSARHSPPWAFENFNGAYLRGCCRVKVAAGDFRLARR